MDPNETLRKMLLALADMPPADHPNQRKRVRRLAAMEDFLEASEDLSSWLKAGGFSPTVLNDSARITFVVPKEKS